MRKWIVALLGDGLYTWDGGVDYLSNIAGVLEYVDANWAEYHIKIYLVLPVESAFVRAGRKLLSKKQYDVKSRFEYIVDVFHAACPKVEIIYYRKHIKKLYDDKGKSLQKTLETIGADICFPILRDYYPRLKTPWIGYIADFQEKYLPELFDRKTLRYRERNSKKQVDNTSYFITTSQAVKEDLERFYPGNYKVFTQPFAPMAQENFLDTSQCHIGIYNLPPCFFLISNQFWAHKSHCTAFEALRLLHERGMEDIHIVCTGKMDADFRNREYSTKLRQKVSETGMERYIHFLGYIPKLDQIEIMKHSRALLQPSLFEGDPGGCSVYNANALLVPVIMSDIRVNREAAGCKEIMLFRAEDAREMADRMECLLKENKKVVATEEIMAHSQKNAEILAGFYMNMISEVTANYHLLGKKCK